MNMVVTEKLKDEKRQKKKIYIGVIERVRTTGSGGRDSQLKGSY